MRLTAKLVRVAALVAAAAAGAAACTPSTSSGGCTGRPPTTTETITSAQACQMIEETNDLQAAEENGFPVNGPTCQQVCTGEFQQCYLPASYLSQARALNPDAGASPGDGGLLAINCPAGPATLTVTCIPQGCP